MEENIKVKNFYQRLNSLNLCYLMLCNGRYAVTLKDGIHTFEFHPENPDFEPVEKIYPAFNELRKNEKFFVAAVKYFSSSSDVLHLDDLCQWLSGLKDECPLEEEDLFYIEGDFHKKTMTFEKPIEMKLRKNSREWLIQSITDKYEQGYVLDGNKMDTDHISYVHAMFDTIKGEWMPCLVKNENDELAVTYFESEDPIPLKDQIHLEGEGGWLLEDVVTQSLRDILEAMIIP